MAGIERTAESVAGREEGGAVTADWEGVVECELG